MVTALAHSFVTVGSQSALLLVRKKTFAYRVVTLSDVPLPACMDLLFLHCVIFNLPPLSETMLFLSAVKVWKPQFLTVV